MTKARNFTLVMGAVLLVLFAGSVASAVQMQSSNNNSAVTGIAGGNVLVDQSSDGGGNGAPDQAFEALYAGYDSEGADDFDVTDAAGWDITGLNITGTHTSGGAVGFGNLFYYDDNGGLPADSPIAGCDFPLLADFVDSAGSIAYNHSVCNLGPGTYWVSQAVRQDFLVGGQHFWSNRTILTGNPGVWRNPGDGFALGCTDWTSMTTCGVGGGTSPDFLFQLIGNLRDTTTGGTGGTGGSGGTGGGGVPAVGPFGLMMMVLALGGGSGYVLARRRNS